MSDFSFCGVAIGDRYRAYATTLANDIAVYWPGKKYVVITDDPRDFQEHSNIIPVRHRQTGLMFPYHDRRFAINEALKRSQAACHIDTDVRILRPFQPMEGVCGGGIYAAHVEDLFYRIKKYQPKNLAVFSQLARKLGIEEGTAKYIGEFIYVVSRLNSKHKSFVEWWGRIALFLELHRLSGADGSAMGLAAHMAGMPIIKADWLKNIEKDHCRHFKAVSGKAAVKRNSLERFRFRIGYHWRLNKARITALRDYKFYYGK